MGSISSIRLYIPLVNLTSISSSASQALLTPWHSLLQHQQIVSLKYHYYCVSKLRYVVSSPYRSDDKKTKYSKLSKNYNQISYTHTSDAPHTWRFCRYITS